MNLLKDQQPASDGALKDYEGMLEVPDDPEHNVVRNSLYPIRSACESEESDSPQPSFESG